VLWIGGILLHYGQPKIFKNASWLSDPSHVLARRIWTAIVTPEDNTLLGQTQAETHRPRPHVVQ
jgi:hypothetical protein